MKLKRAIIALLFLILLSSLVSAGSLKSDLKNIIAKKSPNDKIQVVVLFNKAPLKTDIDLIKSDGASLKHQYKIINAAAINIPAKNADKIAKRPFVKFVEPDYELKTVLDFSTQQIGANNLGDIGFTGKNVDIAVIDTGIHKHPDLTISKEIDFTGEGAEDILGHGTHVAGIIASKNAVYKGIAPDANLLNVKVIRKEGFAYGSDVIKGIEWSIDNDAEIISMSLGALIENCDGTDAISQAVDKATDQGAVVIVAAGNSGPNTKTINSPGCAKKALTVGAVDKTDAIASFSSRGPTSDNRIKPDIVAPGVSITSTWIDDSFKSLSGTSMATPHISGIASLLLEQDSSLTPSSIKEKIQSSAIDLGLDQNTQGAGRINIAKQEVSSNFTTPITKALLSIDYFSLDKYNITAGDSTKVSLSIKNSGDATAESASSTLKIPKGLNTTSSTKLLGDINPSSSAFAEWNINSLQPGNYTIIVDVLSANADPASSQLKLIVNPKQTLEANKTISNETSTNETTSQPPEKKTRKLPPGLAKKTSSTQYFGYGVRNLLENMMLLFYYQPQKPAYTQPTLITEQKKETIIEVEKPEQIAIPIQTKKPEKISQQRTIKIPETKKPLVQERTMPEASQAQTKKTFVETPRIIPKEDIIQEIPQEIETSTNTEITANTSTELPAEAEITAELNTTFDEKINRGKIISSIKISKRQK